MSLWWKKGFWLAQCTFQSSPWWFIDFCRHHITWSKGKQRRHTSHIIQELRYPRLFSVQWLFPYQWRNPCIPDIFYSSRRSLNSLRWNSQIIHFICLNPQEILAKIANEVMTIASGRINSQSKHNLICHVAKVKATTSAHSMATKDLFSVFIIPFESNAQTKRKYIFHRTKNTTSVTLSVYLCFNNVWSKHYRLRDSKLVCISRPTEKKHKILSVT